MVTMMVMMMMPMHGKKLGKYKRRWQWKLASQKLQNCHKAPVPLVIIIIKTIWSNPVWSQVPRLPIKVGWGTWQSSVCINEKCFLHLLLKTICLMSVFKGRICPNKVVCPKNVWKSGIYPDKGVYSPIEPSHASTTCPPSRIWSDFGQESVAGRLVIFVVNLGLVIPTQPFELSGDFRIIT